MEDALPEIRILDDDVANKIAAGEVVERPAAVVKELLENSVDARATRIDVEFKNGGKTFIKVADNGCGMRRDQALMSLESHATSKIRTSNDIFEISTYGFRGEAVPSIASVSRFTMRTRPHSQLAGTQIEVYAGKINTVRECGMPEGTEIAVENLFCEVPARRKFLKSDNVEASHIAKLCRLYALALPDVAITLIENSRLIFRSERNLSLLKRVERVAGTAVAEKLMELKPCKTDGMKLYGAILAPGESFSTSRNICAFINSRPVDCRAIYSAIKEAYAQFVPAGRFAAAYLFLELDPRSVDVNVHPAKREVRLKNEFGVRNFVCEAISKKLSAYTAAINTPFAAKSDAANAEAPAPAPNAPEPPSSFPNEPSPPAGEPRQARTPEQEQKTPNKSPAAPHQAMPKAAITPLSAPQFVPHSEFAKQRAEYAPGSVSIPQETPQKAPSANAPAPAADNAVPNWKYLAQFKGKFAVFEMRTSMVLMNITAAVRRLTYAKLLANLERDGRAAAQTLLIPIPLKLERVDAEILEKNADSFAACGFEMEKFGANFYRIAAIPPWLDLSEAETFVRDFISSARDENISARPRKLGNELFAKTAARKARADKSRQTPEGATRLLRELLQCPSHMSTPDGRPTLREISEAEINRMFSL